MQNVRENASRIVKSVASPLRFFAVIATILGLIIIGLAWKSSLPPDVTELIIVVSFGALFFIIIVVFFLIMFFPKKLVFDQEAHLAVLREQLGDSELQKPYIAGSLPNVSAMTLLPKETDKS